MPTKKTRTVRIYTKTFEQIKKDLKENEKMADAMEKRMRCKFRVI